MTVLGDASTDMDRRCPDCEVTMAEVKFGMKVSANDAWDPYVKTGESRGGILGALGAKQKHDIDPHLCPECGLVRFYADLDS